MNRVLRFKPRIYRTWSARLGRFVWDTNHIPLGVFHTPTLRAWNSASMWCHRQNAKAEGSAACQ